MMAMPCKICLNAEGNTLHVFREMMFGSGDKFDYFQCSACGCLQIREIPDDPAANYDDRYYSFAEPPVLRDNHLKAFAKRLRLAAGLGKGNLSSGIFLRVYPPPDYFPWLQRVSIDPAAEILDVGCGKGNLLIRLRKDGFQNLTGIDPYLQGDVRYDNGVSLLKRDLTDLDREFDFIMLHHSFEHMAEPVVAMQHLHRLLRPQRFLLIRIPVANTYAWRHYGPNWVQIDAPRHFFLHTVESMGILAEKTGFKIAEIVFDSTEFQFWGSEQNSRDIPLRDSRSHAEDPGQSEFSREQIREFKARAKKLNQEQDGDQACFYLYKSN